MLREDSMKKLSSLAAVIVFAVITAGCGQTDPGITTAVKGKFAQDDLVKAHEIEVTTHDHVVRLEGTVESAPARERAVQLARNTDGVRDVIDQLRFGAVSTTGRDDNITIDVTDDVKRGVKETGRAIEKGANATADAAKKAGRSVRGAVT